MADDPASIALQLDNDRLRERLAETEAVLAALSAGEVDALMVGAPGERQVFALEGAETPYRFFVEAMAEGAATVSSAGRILYANTSLARMLRRPLMHLIGAPMAELVEPQERPPLDALLAAAATRRIEREFALCVAGAAPVAALLTGAPLPGPGMAGRVTLVVHDLTERKRAEEQVRALNASLEQQVAQRTIELRESNQALEAFAYSVSHDLRAPLRSIDGFSQILLEDYKDRLDEGGRDSLRRVREASQRMGNLIDAVLILSRASRGDLVLGPVDLSAIAAEAVADLRRTRPLPAMTVTIASGIHCFSDARLLRAVLENLLGNAWKFAANVAAPHIEFAAQTVDGELVCHVRDNGAGFDMAFASSLFIAFHRLHSAADFPGDGIGLATVKRVVSRLGGRVWAEGAVGAGATFYFALPARPITAAVAPPRLAAPPATQGAAP